MKARAAALAIASILLLAGCASSSDEPGAPPEGTGAEGTWSKLPDSPLHPRRSAHAFWTGTELVIAGGTEADACPPTADCTWPEEAPLRTGAAWDPAAESWRRIAAAPVPLGVLSGATVGATVYLLVYGLEPNAAVEPAFLSYDPGRDRWSRLRLPPTRDNMTLASAGDTVIAYQSSQESGITGDFLYDPAADGWTELPADPLRPAYDRDLTWTDHGLVLTGIPHVGDPGVRPSLYRAARFVDGSWTELPESQIVGYNPEWAYLDGLVVNASLVEIDGGETNDYGWSYPTGGMLDPATGDWFELPGAPQPRADGFDVYAAGPRSATAGGGWVYDAPTEGWARLDPPPDAPAPDAGWLDERSLAWTDEGLVVWGGAELRPDDETRLVGDGWLWTPPGERVP